MRARVGCCCIVPALRMSYLRSHAADDFRLRLRRTYSVVDENDMACSTGIPVLLHGVY